MKLDHLLKFLPSPNRSRKQRVVLMLSDEEYSALESAARLHWKESIERSPSQAGLSENDMTGISSIGTLDPLMDRADSALVSR